MIPRMLMSITGTPCACRIDLVASSGLIVGPGPRSCTDLPETPDEPYGIIGSEPGRRRRSRFDAWNLAGPRPTTTCGYFPAAGGPASGGRARPRRRWQQSRGQSATLRAVMAKVECEACRTLALR